MRRVHNLKLAAPRREDVRRAVILLEDALRTASLTHDGRLWLVRTLSLGNIRLQTAATLSLTIEQRWQRLQQTAVHALTPAAADQPVVYFDDIVEAHAALIGRLLDGGKPRAWFWSRAVPAWQPHLSQAEAISVIITALTAGDQGAVHAARLLAELRRQGQLSLFLSQLRAEDGQRLLRMTWGNVEQPGSANGMLPLPAAPVWAAVLDDWQHAWPPGDPRLVWLVAMTAIAGRPALLHDSNLAQRAALWVEHMNSSANTNLARLPEDGASSPPIEPASLPSSQPGRRQKAPHTGGETGRRSQAQTANVSENQPLRAAPDETLGHEYDHDAQHNLPGELKERQARDELLLSPAWTKFAGLLFLINLLRRLNLESFLDENPAAIEGDLPARIFLTIAERLGIESDDPMLQPFQLGMAPAQLSISLSRWLELWLAEMVTWCDEVLEQSLEELVRRPGKISVTRTHIDLYFELDQIDIMLRKTGLDFDPGWVSWLGRVVTFHYQ